MATTDSVGKCQLCEETLNFDEMRNHLKFCVKKQDAVAGSEKTKYFHIAVKGRFKPRYWLNLGVDEQCFLTQLDEFLRDKWLECCNHSSEFIIHKKFYVSDTRDSFF